VLVAKKKAPTGRRLFGAAVSRGNKRKALGISYNIRSLSMSKIR
jgi:hypothetical protein